LLFLRVPEEKAGKNRLHLDLRPADQAAKVARLERLGASRTDVGQGSDVSWVVMADPDGNEFCVPALTPPEAGVRIAGNEIVQLLPLGDAQDRAHRGRSGRSQR
jgi:Glyoxalase-like domain